MFARFSLIIIIVCNSFYTNAIDAAGVKLEKASRLTVDKTQLILNGSAVRREAQHEIYVGGLYLKEQSSSFDEIISDPSPKRFLFFCSTDVISSNKLVSAWEQGFSINYTEEEVLKLKPMILEFNKVWSSGLQAGDEIWVDFLPDQGTHISINGKIISKIPGDEFYHAFLKTWLGPHPFSLKMKEALLGN